MSDDRATKLFAGQLGIVAVLVIGSCGAKWDEWPFQK
jgi:hypothetical protein